MTSHQNLPSSERNDFYKNFVTDGPGINFDAFDELCIYFNYLFYLTSIYASINGDAKEIVYPYSLKQL